MKTVLNNAAWWVTGVVVAFSGVLLSMVSQAKLSGGLQLKGVLVGELLGLAGLLVICAGVSRRLRRAQPEKPIS